jgi:hypothetical protein
LTLILDISNITILISSVGHNLGSGIREDDTVRTAGLVSITVLRVSKVVGVGITDSILKSILGRNIRVDLSTIGWLGSWGISRSRCWSWSWGISRSRGWSWGWGIGWGRWWRRGGGICGSWSWSWSWGVCRGWSWGIWSRRGRWCRPVVLRGSQCHSSEGREGEDLKETIY